MRASVRTRLAVFAAAGALVAAVGVTLAAHAATVGCSVAYSVTSQWPGGFGANVSVTNLGDPVNGARPQARSQVEKGSMSWPVPDIPPESGFGSHRRIVVRQDGAIHLRVQRRRLLSDGNARSSTSHRHEQGAGSDATGNQKAASTVTVPRSLRPWGTICPSSDRLSMSDDPPAGWLTSAPCSPGTHTGPRNTFHICCSPLVLQTERTPFELLVEP